MNRVYWDPEEKGLTLRLEKERWIKTIPESLGLFFF